MRTTIAAIALLAVVAALGGADAATTGTGPSNSTCSHLAVTLGASTRAFSIAEASNSGPNILTCSLGAFGLSLVPAGGSITLTCTESTSGIAPPGVADTNGIVLRAFADNTAFPASPGTPGFWSRAYSSCSPQQNFAFWCTSDGTNTGSPRHGPVRIYVSATRSSIPTYSDDSDHGSQGTNVASYGILLCTARETGLTFTPAQPAYPGGKVVTETLTLASSAYTNVNVGQLRVKCGSPWDTRSGMTGTFAQSASPAITSTIQPASWPQGCGNLRLNASITAHSALSGYTTLPYTVFDASSTDAPSNSTQSWTTSSQGTFRVGPTDIEKDAPGMVSYIGSFDGVNMTRCDAGVPTCANVSAFTISADSAYGQAWGLRDSAGGIVPGVSVTCTQKKPGGATFATATMGATDARGTAPIQPLTVTTPKGTWSLTCTANWSGNTATYTVQFGFVSAYTADVALSVKWNVTYLAANETFLANVTGTLHAYDPDTDDVAPIAPDAPPRCTILGFDASTATYSRVLAARVVTTPAAGPSSTFWCLAWLTRADIGDAFAFVYANVTGAPFVGHAGYSLPTAVGALDIVGDARIRGDASVSGAIAAGSLSGTYDISQANGMISTSFDPYVQPLIFGGLILASSAASLWIARQRGILGKLAIATLLVITAIWAANASVASDANPFRWVAVLVTAGWALIVIFSMKGQGVRR